MNKTNASKTKEYASAKDVQKESSENNSLEGLKGLKLLKKLGIDNEEFYASIPDLSLLDDEDAKDNRKALIKHLEEGNINYFFASVDGLIEAIETNGEEEEKKALPFLKKLAKNKLRPAKSAPKAGKPKEANSKLAETIKLLGITKSGYQEMTQVLSASENDEIVEYNEMITMALREGSKHRAGIDAMNLYDIIEARGSDEEKELLDMVDKIAKGRDGAMKSPSSEEASNSTPTPLAYINEADAKECKEKIKTLAKQRREEKIEKLRAEALQNAKTKEEREEIKKYNSVQDFTGGNKVAKTVATIKTALDYQERQRIMSLSKNNPNDEEKKLLYRDNKEKLDKTQTKASVQVEKALEKLSIELHRRFEAGENIENLNFEVDIIISK